MYLLVLYHFILSYCSSEEDLIKRLNEWTNNVENSRSQCRRLQDGRVVHVAEVLVVIQYNVLVVRSGYTRSVVV